MHDTFAYAMFDEKHANGSIWQVSPIFNASITTGKIRFRQMRSKVNPNCKSLSNTCYDPYYYDFSQDANSVLYDGSQPWHQFETKE